MLCAREAGDHRGERVVVTELDLGGADGVVLIDDGDGAVADELAQGLLHAEVAGAQPEIIMCEEHLGDGEAVRGEAGLPRLHEQRLADGGAGLFFGNLLRFLGEAEPAHAEADGAGGDHDDLGAAGAERGDIRADGGDARGVELADAGGENAGAEFDDDAPGARVRGVRR